MIGWSIKWYDNILSKPEGVEDVEYREKVMQIIMGIIVQFKNLNIYGLATKIVDTLNYIYSGSGVGVKVSNLAQNSDIFYNIGKYNKDTDDDYYDYDDEPFDFVIKTDGVVKTDDDRHRREVAVMEHVTHVEYLKLKTNLPNLDIIESF